jgi:hypothetical protein
MTQTFSRNLILIGATMLASLFFLLPQTSSAAVLPIPDGVTSAEIGHAALGTGWEPSGMVWHSRLNGNLVVSDEGKMALLDLEGNLLDSWSIGYDLEGVAVVDAASDLIYLADERNGVIREFSLATDTLTGVSWDVSAWLANTASNQGMEALTFVPDGAHPYGATAFGGAFYAGVQESGNIHIFSVGSSITELGVIASNGVTDISGLHFDASTGYVVAVHDGWNLGRLYTTAGTLVAEMTLPGDNQEGVTGFVTADGVVSVFIAEDAGGSGRSEVWRYTYDASALLITEEPEEEVVEEPVEEEEVVEELEEEEEVIVEEPEVIEEEPEVVCVDVPVNGDGVKYTTTSDCQFLVASNGRFVKFYNMEGEKVAQRWWYRRLPEDFQIVVMDLYDDGIEDVMMVTSSPVSNRGRIALSQFDGSDLVKTGHARMMAEDDRTTTVLHVDAALGTVLVSYGDVEVLYHVTKEGKPRFVR